VAPGRMSGELYERARQSLVGGVNSPVRCFDGVGMSPLFAARGKGPHIFDADGKQYIDLLNGWGSLILGHADDDVTRAIGEAAAGGTVYGLSTEIECELAEAIREAFPSVERLRLVNSGTEAVMSAVRLARGYTGRTKILKFEGCYHGHHDGLLVKAGSGLATLGLPASGGVPAAFTGETLLARYNDLDSVASVGRTHGDALACVLVEPVAGNMGVVPPGAGFLAGLRAFCDRVGALLIFDEVITGFRVGWGGAQQRFGVRPDLTTLGKIIGGGLPVGAFGGPAEIMNHLAPLGDVYQAGTLSGNPVVAAAGLTVLRRLKAAAPYERLEQLGISLEKGLSEAARAAGVPLRIGRVGSMLTPFFTETAVTDYVSARSADGERYGRFFGGMLERGVLLPPSPWESAFLTTAHGEADVETVLGAARKTLAGM